MEDPYEWKEHKARLEDTSVLLLIYTALLALLVLSDPAPTRTSDDSRVLLSLQSSQPVLTQRNVGEGANDIQNEPWSDGSADAHCNQRRLSIHAPNHTMPPCDRGR